MNLNSFDYISSQLDHGLLMNLTNYVQYGRGYAVQGGIQSVPTQVCNADLSHHQHWPVRFSLQTCCNELI